MPSSKEVLPATPEVSIPLTHLDAPRSGTGQLSIHLDLTVEERPKESFAGEVIIDEADAALAYARGEYKDGKAGKCMVFWTDGVIKGCVPGRGPVGFGGSGVV